MSKEGSIDKKMLKDFPELGMLSNSEKRSLDLYKTQIFERANEIMLSKGNPVLNDLTWKMGIFVQDLSKRSPEEDRGLVLLAAELVQRRIMLMLQSASQTPTGKKIIKAEQDGG